MSRFGAIGLCACLLSLSLGCVSSKPPNVRIEGPSTAISWGIDPRDYDEVGKFMSDSMAKCKDLKKGVAVLGPVVTSLDPSVQLDVVTLQERLQVICHRAGLLDFLWPVDCTQGGSAAEERYKVIQVQWEKESTVDQEELRIFGSLAKVDYMLFGRVSCIRSDRRDASEAVYTFHYVLGDCESGLVVWVDEMQIVKSKP